MTDCRVVRHKNGGGHYHPDCEVDSSAYIGSGVNLMAPSVIKSGAAIKGVWDIAQPIFLDTNTQLIGRGVVPDYDNANYVNRAREKDYVIRLININPSGNSVTSSLTLDGFTILGSVDLYNASVELSACLAETMSINFTADMFVINSVLFASEKVSEAVCGCINIENSSVRVGRLVLDGQIKISDSEIGEYLILYNIFGDYIKKGDYSDGLFRSFSVSGEEERKSTVYTIGDFTVVYNLDDDITIFDEKEIVVFSGTLAKLEKLIMVESGPNSFLNSAIDDITTSSFFKGQLLSLLCDGCKYSNAQKETSERQLLL